MIKMQIIGRLGKDCVTNTVNGKSVINFSAAHSEKYKDSQGNTQEKTVWVDCAYWTDRTAIANYLTKGKEVFVEGTPEVRTFTRQDGTAGASLSLRVREVQLLGGRADGGAAPATNNGGYNNNNNQNSYSNANSNNGGNSYQPSEVTEPMDDLPF